jgi:undecaprenyl diphosphate synthase
MESAIKHVAIIMDGNGRWANQRFRPRVWGHVRGSGVVSDIVEAADDLGVAALTLYAFSTENWSRPHDEVGVLFRLLHKFLKKERRRILDNDISFRVIGDTRKLPTEVLKLIAELEGLTMHAKGLKLTFCFGYGGRSEIISAINTFQQQTPGAVMTEADLARSLFRPDTGDVDLLIRTGGEQRVSNFLLWQIAYAELYFTPTKWPDFTASEFQKILASVEKRERRFGTISPRGFLQHSAAARVEAQNLNV